jgi:hypothetical protein
MALFKRTSYSPCSEFPYPVKGNSHILVREYHLTALLPGGGTFEGTLSLVRFVVQDGALVAVGRLSDTLTDAAGNVIGTVRNLRVNLPVGVQQATCDILVLELGPMDLNLLGLNVFLDTVYLEITAEQGPGNLLGNLLCAVAGLLDSGGPLSQVANLLNQILGILRRL